MPPIYMNCFGPESFKLGGGGLYCHSPAKLQFIVTAHPSSSLARLLPQPSQAKLQLWKKLLSSFSEFRNFCRRNSEIYIRDMMRPPEKWQGEVERLPHMETLIDRAWRGGNWVPDPNSDSLWLPPVQTGIISIEDWGSSTVKLPTAGPCSVR